jgi:hypothetical protein
VHLIRRPPYVKPDNGERERVVQRGIITIAEAMRCHAIHVPNGAHLAGGKLARAKQMAALKKDGLRVGFPDLILIDRTAIRRIGFVEVKRELGGVVSDDQERWAEWLGDLGFPYALLRQPEELVATFREWGWR